MKIITGIWPPNVINIASVDEAGIEVEFIKTMEYQMNCKLSMHIDDAEDMGLKFGDNEEPTGRMGLLKVYGILVNMLVEDFIHLHTIK